MFSKTPSKGFFFKRASSWKDKHSKQKSTNSGSTSEGGRVYRATSLNDVSFQGSNESRDRGETSMVVGLSFSKIQIDDDVSGGVTNSAFYIDPSNRYQLPPSGYRDRKRLGGSRNDESDFRIRNADQNTSCSVTPKEQRKGARIFATRSVPRPTFISHINDVPRTDVPEQIADKSVKSPEKRSVSSKACVDCPVSQNTPTNQVCKRSPGDGLDSSSKNPLNVRFSTGNTSIRSYQKQPGPMNICVGCHGPLLQTPTNQSSRQEGSTSIKSPVSIRHSTGNAQRKTESPKLCISCRGPIETPPTSRQLGGATRAERLNAPESRIPVKSPTGNPTRSPRIHLDATTVHCSRQQQARSSPQADGSNHRSPVQIATGNRSSQVRCGSSPQTNHSRFHFPVFDPTERDSVESFDDFDVLKEARQVLKSLQRDIAQSLDAVSSNTTFPGVSRKSSGRDTASSGVQDPHAIDSLPSGYETRLKIVQACQTRCLEYREMIRNITESVLEKTKRFDSSATVNSLQSLHESFGQLKVNCSDFKEMCVKGVGDARADGNLSKDMALFVQNLCLNTLQMQNDVFLERLQTGFALIRAHCKLIRFVEACSCCIRD